MWLTIVTAVLGILSTLLAYFLAPQRKKDKLRQQLVDVYKDLEALERKRDEALQSNDTAMLTIITNNIIKLRNCKANIFQQLGQS
jgi:type II secretory pathway pseudopilin PulG